MKVLIVMVLACAVFVSSKLTSAIIPISITDELANRTADFAVSTYSKIYGTKMTLIKIEKANAQEVFGGKNVYEDILVFVKTGNDTKKDGADGRKLILTRKCSFKVFIPFEEQEKLSLEEYSCMV